MYQAPPVAATGPSTQMTPSTEHSRLSEEETKGKNRAAACLHLNLGHSDSLWGQAVPGRLGWNVCYSLRCPLDSPSIQLHLKSCWFVSSGVLGVIAKMLKMRLQRVVQPMTVGPRETL